MVVKSTVSLHQTQFLNETTIGFCVFEVSRYMGCPQVIHVYYTYIYTIYIHRVCRPLTIKDNGDAHPSGNLSKSGSFVRRGLLS